MIAIGEKKITPQARYDKVNTFRIGLKLNLKSDADILTKLEAVPNKQGFIKAAIRKAIADENETK